MIPVNKPFLPSFEEYSNLIKQIWENNILTNRGPQVIELENQLKEYLGTRNLLFVTNGTIAIQLAIKALKLNGEIITTPFSYVATTSSIVWEGCTPIFVDIDPNTLCIDHTKIENSITHKTTAILATHVYGIPCEIDEIEKIARKHSLRVIYDGAHCFGVKYKNRSIFDYGDFTTCSTHATKVFHSIEGGFVCASDSENINLVQQMSNFGHLGPYSYDSLGINGKNSEVHAAMGLANLCSMEKIFEKRKVLTQTYDKNLVGLNFKQPLYREESTRNYSYYPIIFNNEEELLKVESKLSSQGIICRRYFYPSLSSCLPYVKNIDLEICDDLSRRVLCLPLYYDLTENDVNRICNIIKETI